MTSSWYLSTLVVLFLYLPLVGFAQDNSTSVSEKTSDSNMNMTSLNLTNASTICNLRISDAAIKNIVRLMHIHTTNVVEIQVSIDSRNKTRIFKWPWASEIGRTIISLIAHPTLVASSLQLSTLTRGILKAQVVVSEENYGCLPPGNNGSDRVFDFLSQQLSRAVDTHDYDHYKLCRAPNNENGGKQYNCCTVANDGKLLICADHSSIVLKYADNYLDVMSFIVTCILLPLVLKYLRSLQEESDCYEITHSPMALSSIFHTVFFYGSDNPAKSWYRRLAVSLTIAVLCFIGNSSTSFRIAVLIWVFPFTAFDIFGINANLTDKIGEYDFYNIYLTALTLPFNFKYWWNVFESTLKRCNCNRQQQSDCEQQAEPVQPTDPQQPTTCKKQACRKFMKGLFFIFLYFSGLVVIIFLTLIGASTAGFLTLCFTLAKCEHIYYKHQCVFSLFGILYMIFLIASLTFIGNSINSFLKLMLFLIAGLYLNVAFYGPIVAPTVSLIVYFYKHWRSSVEAEYLQLKTKIYDVCKELWDNTPNNSNPNSGERNDPQFCVDLKEGKVPKALYEEIGEKRLPYYKVVFNFFARMFFVANFYLVVAVMMLLAQQSGISGPARIISTIIVSTLPFFFDLVWAEHTSQQADVNDKRLKLHLRKIIQIKSETDNTITVTLENEENATKQLHTIMDVFKLMK